MPVRCTVLETGQLGADVVATSAEATRTSTARWRQRRYRARYPVLALDRSHGHAGNDAAAAIDDDAVDLPLLRKRRSGQHACHARSETHQP